MIKRALCLLSVAICAATAAQAQPPTGGGPVGTAQALKQQYAMAKANLTAGLEKLSEADFGFKPTPDIRAYGALFTHVADAHYFICATAKGAPNPNQASLEQTQTSKADVVKALNDSFAFCDDAFASLDDQNINQMMAGGRGPQQSKGALLLGLIAHDNEMYGISTVYQRLKGAVPPSTEQMQQLRRGGPGGGR